MTKTTRSKNSKIFGNPRHYAKTGQNRRRVTGQLLIKTVKVNYKTQTDRALSLHKSFQVRPISPLPTGDCTGSSPEDGGENGEKFSFKLTLMKYLRRLYFARNSSCLALMAPRRFFRIISTASWDKMLVSPSILGKHFRLKPAWT